MLAQLPRSRSRETFVSCRGGSDPDSGISEVICSSIQAENGTNSIVHADFSFCSVSSG
jgi:hypothetical protein